jgi:hypothetical protein
MQLDFYFIFLQASSVLPISEFPQAVENATLAEK